MIFHPDILLASTPKEHRSEMVVVFYMLKRGGRAEGVKVDLGSEQAQLARTTAHHARFFIQA